MYIWWIFLFLTCKPVADPSRCELVNNDDDFQMKLSPKKIGRMKYLDGEIMIFQNKHKHTDFFFTPFPYVQHEQTQCYENVLNDHIELGLQVELYTSQLIEAVQDYLYKHQSVLCGNTTSSFICDVSLLPINSIRLVQRNFRSSNTHQKYTLEDSWQSNDLLLQSMEFVIYVPNMTLCKQLRTTLTEKCRLPNIEMHYSIHDQQTVQRQIEVNTEHISSTNIYNQIRAQFPSTETVLLTENDFRELLSQSTDRIIMTLRSQDGFDSLQEPMAINKLLKQHLSTQQIRLEMINDKLWKNLYWNAELTRPDHLAKILNLIIRAEGDDSENFIYNRKIAKGVMKNNSTNSLKHQKNRSHLTYYDKLRLRQIDQQFDSHNLHKVGIEKGRPVNNRVNNNDTNEQYILNRDEVEKFLHEFSDDIYLDDDTVKPRPIKVRFVKIDKLIKNMKLFSGTILVRMRSNVYKLPVRCKTNDNKNKEECVKMDQLDKLYMNLTAMIQQGLNGAQCDSRFPGAQDCSGLAGQVGRSGMSGPPGFQGLPGIPGDRGVNGLPGLPGVKGEPGLPGLPGLKGESGLPGLPGTRGDRGANGVSGLPGLKGEPGLPGIRGTPGFPGVPGDRGVNGVSGLSGLKGEPGLPGIRGTPGFPGIPGDRGVNGVPGLSGLKGEPGLPGMRGTPGFPGVPGVPGDRGVNGLPGLPGLKGEPGFPGLPGIPGNRGVNGLPGLPGMKGEPGFPGVPGMPGDRGAPGFP